MTENIGEVELLTSTVVGGVEISQRLQFEGDVDDELLPQEPPVAVTFSVSDPEL